MHSTPLYGCTYLAQMKLSCEDSGQHPETLLHRHNSVSDFRLPMKPQPSNFYNSDTHSAPTQLLSYLFMMMMMMTIITINVLPSVAILFWQNPSPFLFIISFSQPSIPVRASPKSSINHLSFPEDGASTKN